jgi:glycosyltransferase involved in cell wall biosynthesis
VNQDYSHQHNDKNHLDLASAVNILHLSTHDAGGAGKAAHRLHQNLRTYGLHSKMLVLNKQSDDKDVIPFAKRDFILQSHTTLAKTWLKLRTNTKYYFQNQATLISAEDILNSIPFTPDIIIAHWVSNFVTAENFYQLSQHIRAPILWYLMDMAPLTGGCHYAWDCRGYTSHCGKCPALYSRNPHDQSYRNLGKKHTFIEKTDLTVVAATGWINEQARKATVFSGKRVVKIMLGVDSELFKPVAKDLARARLKLPSNKKIMFFGAQSMKLERKGMAPLVAALKLLAREYDLDKLLIVTAGNVSSMKSFLKHNFKHIHLGFLTDDTLATAYQAADLFVCPSIEDSGPMMINEAIMCGTPVVSFKMGVAVDLVHTGKTGYRAELNSSEDLAKGMRYLLALNPQEAKKMAKQCRDLSLKLYSPQVQAQAFKSLFEQLLIEA